MRNNAAYLPESPIVYIILPKSIRNRASFFIFVYLFEAQIRLILFAEDKNVNIMQNTEFLNSELTEYSIWVIIKKTVCGHCRFGSKHQR